MKSLAMILTVTIPTLAVVKGGPDAAVYLPPDYDGRPMPVLYWLHWYQGTAHWCPPMERNPGFIVVAPYFRPEADWENYDLSALVAQIEARYPTTERWIEGYSRGAYGAVWHAARNPRMFDRVIALAGGYPDSPQVVDPLTIVAGTRDQEWGPDSLRYASDLGTNVLWVDSTHHPLEFYENLDWERLYE